MVLTERILALLGTCAETLALEELLVAARRMNRRLDLRLDVFSPSPPLLVGAALPGSLISSRRAVIERALAVGVVNHLSGNS